MTDYLDSPGTDETLSIDADTLMNKKIQAGGKKYIFARAGSAIVAKTPYSVLYEGGLAGTDPVVKAKLITAVKQLVVVPLRAMADDDRGWFQYGGLVEDMVVPSATYTATHALKVDAGAITSIGAAPANLDTEIGSVVVGGTTVTAIDVNLFGREALTET